MNEQRRNVDFCLLHTAMSIELFIDIYTDIYIGNYRYIYTYAPK